LRKGGSAVEERVNHAEKKRERCVGTNKGVTPTAGASLEGGLFNNPASQEAQKKCPPSRSFERRKAALNH